MLNSGRLLYQVGIHTGRMLNTTRRYREFRSPNVREPDNRLQRVSLNSARRPDVSLPAGSPRSEVGDGCDVAWGIPPASSVIVMQ